MGQREICKGHYWDGVRLEYRLWIGWWCHIYIKFPDSDNYAKFM